MNAPTRRGRSVGSERVKGRKRKPALGFVEWIAVVVRAMRLRRWPGSKVIHGRTEADQQQSTREYQGTIQKPAQISSNFPALGLVDDDAAATQRLQSTVEVQKGCQDVRRHVAAAAVVIQAPAPGAVDDGG